MSKTKIAVYGSLRKELHNHFILGEAKYLGKFESKPIFTMYSLAMDSYPGILLGGTTSVVFEVYEVDEKTEARVDNLEGYNKNNKAGSMYDKKRIMTPFGESYFYEYNSKTGLTDLVPSGDWYIYKTEDAEINKHLKKV